MLFVATFDSGRVMSPVSLRERIDIVDILRGCAIFGMLVVNFSHDLPWGYLFPKLWPGTADRVAYFLLLFFFKGKFYTLFSFLFGWGFALQMDRAEARGVSFFGLYARRLFVLFLIGIACWIFWDETLTTYALLGYLLFLFRSQSLKAVLVATLLCLSVGPVQEIVIGRIHAYRLAEPSTAAATRQADAKAEAEETTHEQESLRLHSHGTFKEFIVYETGDVARSLSSHSFYLGMLMDWFPLLLLGLYVGRRGILQDVSKHLGFVRQVFCWGLSLGLVGNAVGVLLSEYPDSWPFSARWHTSLVLDVAFYRIGIPALCFFYASAVVLLAQRPAWKLRLGPLAAVGRMALSNYLLQVLIFDALFQGWGLGFYGRMGPLLGVAAGVLMFLLEVLLSTWWMKRFQFGPAEWLWRTLTYGKLQPMRMPGRAESGDCS